MKKAFLLFGMILMSSPLAARADLTSRFTSSVQLQVNAAATQMQRVGNSYSISGTNVDTTDGTTANITKKWFQMEHQDVDFLNVV